MFNFNGKGGRTRQRISAVIVALLVLAMLISTLSYLLF